MFEFRVMAVQMNALKEDIPHNLEVHMEFIAEASDAGCALVVFPELSVTAHYCIIRVMPTIDSDGCRPLVPGHVDQLFRAHGVQFCRNTGIGGRLALESVDGMLRNLNGSSDPEGSGAG